MSWVQNLDKYKDGGAKKFDLKKIAYKMKIRNINFGFILQFLIYVLHLKFGCGNRLMNNMYLNSAYMIWFSRKEKLYRKRSREDREIRGLGCYRMISFFVQKDVVCRLLLVCLSLKYNYLAYIFKHQNIQNIINLIKKEILLGLLEYEFV
jgi:hypothetical protein